jgi:hypothetical protein
LGSSVLPNCLVAEYQLVRVLPEPLDTNLPSIEEIEAELSRDLEGEEGMNRERRTSADVR